MARESENAARLGILIIWPKCRAVFRGGGGSVFGSRCVFFLLISERERERRLWLM